MRTKLEDFRKHWTPTAENFFQRVSAGHLVDLFCESVDFDTRGERVAVFANLKKSEKAEKMEKLASDPITQNLTGLSLDQRGKLDKRVLDSTSLLLRGETQLAPLRRGYFFVK